MLDNDKLDDLYGKKFEDFELPVSDKLLLNIKKELVVPKGKKEIAYWKWILSCLILSVTITFAYFTFTNSNKKQPITHGDLTTQNISNIVADKNSETVPKVKSEVNKNSSTKHSVNDISDQPIRLNETQLKHQGDTLKNNNTSTVSKNDVERTKENKNASDKKSNSKSISEKSSNKNDQNNSTAAKKIVDENKKQSTVENKTNAEKNEYPVSNNKSKDVNNKESNNEKKASSINNGNLITENPKSDPASNNISLAAANNDNINKAEVENKTIIVSNDSLKQDSIPKPQSSLVKDSALQKTNSEKIPEQKRSSSDKTAYFIGVNGGSSSSFRSLSGNDPIIASRNDAEKKILTYSAGIDLGVIIKNKIVLNVGIGVDNKGEKYSFDGLEAKFALSGYDMHWDSLNQHMDTVPIYEETESAVPARSVQNKYQFLRIPVMVGYCFTIKEKWFITPSVGININYLLNASSSWFNPATRQYVLYNKSDNVFAPFSFAGRIKLDLGMNINDNWSFSIQPGYTRFLQSIYRKGDDKKLFPYSYDLNLGMRYKF